MDCKIKVLEIQNVFKKFPNGNVALNDVSFSVHKGEFVVIAGSNGSGKSVLMKLIAGLDFCSSGKIVLEKDISVGLVFQDAESQILGETVFEDVAFGTKNCGLKKQALYDCVKNALEKVGLWEKNNFLSRMLSGGEKRRLGVAGIIAMNRNFFIFDEPFANLDYPGIKSVCEILKQLKEEGKTVVILTHELEKILALADRFIVLDKGKICFDGTAQEGLCQDLENWNIKTPVESLEKLIWL